VGRETSPRGSLGPPPYPPGKKMEERTALNTGFRLNLAVSYGARSDIGNACRRLCEEAFRGEIRPEQVGEEAIASVRLKEQVPVRERTQVVSLFWISYFRSLFDSAAALDCGSAAVGRGDAHLR